MAPAVAGTVAALTGFAVMALELTAVRVLAPHFGLSAYVWTNVIGVMLLALALGAFVGGRMADRELGRQRLSTLLLIAGLLACAVPLWAWWLGAALLPLDLPLDAAMGALVRGSLVATTLLFAPPVLLIGCVTPMLVKLLVKEHGRVGGASGLVSAMSTVGSLVGTFAATHALVPYLGSRVTVWVCAAILIVSGLLCRGNLARASALLPVVVLPFFSLGHMRGVGEGEELVREVESAYQYLQVVVREDPEQGRSSILKINEGLDSFHSVSFHDTPYTHGMYYDYHVVAPYLAGQGTAPAPLRALSLGSAARTFGRLYGHAFPGCTVDAVELDPAVHRLGRDRELFPGKLAAGRDYAGLDGRVFVNRAPADTYDVVLVDTYERQIYIPAHIASRQFFAAVRRILKQGGVVSVNSGGTSFDDPALGALAATMADVFGQAWAFRVPRSRNFVLVARRGGRLDWRVLARARTEDKDLLRVLEECQRAGSWQEYDVPSSSSDARTLDDDQPWLDVLQERQYACHQAAATLLPMTGDEDPRVVDAAARRLLDQGRFEGGLAVLKTARGETAYLRYLAGYARWALRDLEGTILELQRARRLGMSGMDEQIANALQDAAPMRLAAGIATRNGWLAVVVGVVLLGGVWLWSRSYT
ncbi:MAG: fused MFS/spermidine synthase [Planctomycetota bacterium]|jgi:hypothetical protein